MFDRWYSDTMARKVKRPFVHLLFGARQTGKSTLLGSLLPTDAVRIDLSDPGQRARYLADPGEFPRMCRALPVEPLGRVVFVDEAQTVPAIFDAVQHLYDADKARFRFVLCGSSARKLRMSGANLLPGRSFLHHLHPLVLAEQPAPQSAAAPGQSPLPFPWPGDVHPARPFPAWDLEPRLAYGALPGVVTSAETDRADILRAFTTAHLEEEIRRETMVRDWGVFLRFLRFAAQESGQILNYAAISQETGASAHTVKSYFQMLEDMFIGFHVTAFSRSPRKNVLSTSRFFFFDLGIRHAAAGLTPSVEMVQGDPGPLFEQWVGLELWKRLQYTGDGRLHYFRTRDGAEVDFVVERGAKWTPVEVKWTDRPSSKDARHLRVFMRENPKAVDMGYIICRCPTPQMIEDRILALPWWCL
jgi:predicted AAA+ superfamily ATPase